MRDKIRAERIIDKYISLSNNDNIHKNAEMYYGFIVCKKIDSLGGLSYSERNDYKNLYFEKINTGG